MLPRETRQLVEKAGQEVVVLTSSATVTSYSLEPFERVVRCYTDGSNALAIVLPPASECPGVIFDITHVVRDTVNVTICLHNTPTTPITGGTLNADGEYAVLQSNGFEYRLLAGDGS